jgi:hypothetical protein
LTFYFETNENGSGEGKLDVYFRQRDFDWTSYWTELQSLGTYDLYDGTTHNIKMQMTMNTLGQADGILKLYVDDTLILEKTNVELREIAGQQFNQLILGPYTNTNAPSGGMSLYVDNLKLGDIVPVVDFAPQYYRDAEGANGDHAVYQSDRDGILPAVFGHGLDYCLNGADGYNTFITPASNGPTPVAGSSCIRVESVNGSVAHGGYFTWLNTGKDAFNIEQGEEIWFRFYVYSPGPSNPLGWNEFIWETPGLGNSHVKFATMFANDPPGGKVYCNISDGNTGFQAFNEEMEDNASGSCPYWSANSFSPGAETNTTLPQDQWVRIEYYMLAHNSCGEGRVRFYMNDQLLMEMDGASGARTLSSAAGFIASFQLCTNYNNGYPGASGDSFFIDQIAMTSTKYLATGGTPPNIGSDGNPIIGDWLPFSTFTGTEWNFEGTEGQPASGSDAYDAPFDSVFSTTYVKQGLTSARCYNNGQIDQFGDFGGQVNWPVSSGQGDEFWFSVAMLFPAGYDFTSAGQGQKTIRLMNKGPSDENGGGLDLLISGGTGAPQVNIGNEPGTSVFYETYPEGERDNVSTFNRGEWVTFDAYCYLSAVDGEAITRWYQNGTLIFEDTAARNIKESNYTHNFMFTFSYLNGPTAPGYCYVDKMRFATSQSQLAGNLGSDGNPIIGDL